MSKSNPLLRTERKEKDVNEIRNLPGTFGNAYPLITSQLKLHIKYDSLHETSHNQKERGHITTTTTQEAARENSLRALYLALEPLPPEERESLTLIPQRTTDLEKLRTSLQELAKDVHLRLDDIEYNRRHNNEQNNPANIKGLLKSVETAIDNLLTNLDQTPNLDAIRAKHEDKRIQTLQSKIAVFLSQQLSVLLDIKRRNRTDEQIEKIKTIEQTLLLLTNKNGFAGKRPKAARLARIKRSLGIDSRAVEKDIIKRMHRCNYGVPAYNKEIEILQALTPKLVSHLQTLHKAHPRDTNLIKQTQQLIYLANTQLALDVTFENNQCTVAHLQGEPIEEHSLLGELLKNYKEACDKNDSKNYQDIRDALEGFTDKSKMRTFWLPSEHKHISKDTYALIKMLSKLTQTKKGTPSVTLTFIKDTFFNDVAPANPKEQLEKFDRYFVGLFNLLQAPSAEKLDVSDTSRTHILRKLKISWNRLSEKKGLTHRFATTEMFHDEHLPAPREVLLLNQCHRLMTLFPNNEEYQTAFGLELQAFSYPPKKENITALKNLRNEMLARPKIFLEDTRDEKVRECCETILNALQAGKTKDSYQGQFNATRNNPEKKRAFLLKLSKKLPKLTLANGISGFVLSERLTTALIEHPDFKTSTLDRRQRQRNRILLNQAEYNQDEESILLKRTLAVMVKLYGRPIDKDFYLSELPEQINYVAEKRTPTTHWKQDRRAAKNHKLFSLLPITTAFFMGLGAAMTNFVAFIALASLLTFVTINPVSLVILATILASMTLLANLILVKEAIKKCRVSFMIDGDIANGRTTKRGKAMMSLLFVLAFSIALLVGVSTLISALSIPATLVFVPSFIALAAGVVAGFTSFVGFGALFYGTGDKYVKKASKGLKKLTPHSLKHSLKRQWNNFKRDSFLKRIGKILFLAVLPLSIAILTVGVLFSAIPTLAAYWNNMVSLATLIQIPTKIATPFIAAIVILATPLRLLFNLDGLLNLMKGATSYIGGKITSAAKGTSYFVKTLFTDPAELLSTIGESIKNTGTGIKDYASKAYNNPMLVIEGIGHKLYAAVLFTASIGNAFMTACFSGTGANVMTSIFRGMSINTAHGLTLVSASGVSGGSTGGAAATETQKTLLPFKHTESPKVAVEAMNTLLENNHENSPKGRRIDTVFSTFFNAAEEEAPANETIPPTTPPATPRRRDHRN